jgi:hypothetical protein
MYPSRMQREHLGDFPVGDLRKDLAMVNLLLRSGDLVVA